MRPLRLEIEGLRSYRHKQEIDLDKRGLVAIIGDTGAGKSSILEALVYALYNATTWDQRGVKALMADGARKLAVVLDFSADGKEWRVTRSTGAQPIHELLCVSHPDDLMGRVDGEAAVNAAIEELVGLNYEAFRSAVVLPQGRFQQLLTSSPRDRTAILKGILRVDDLEVVRDLATNALERMRPTLSQRIEERGQYFPDPAARAAAAAAERKQWDARVAALTAAHDQSDAQERSISDAHKEAARLDTLRASVSKAVTGQAAGLLQLVSVERQIDQLRTTVETEINEATRRESTATAALDAAAAAGVGLAEIGAILGTLERLGNDVIVLADQHTEVAALRARQVETEAQSAADPGRIAKLETSERDAANTFAQAESRLHGATDAVISAQDLLRRYRQSIADVETATGATASAITQSEAATTRLAETKSAVASSRAIVNAEQQGVDALQRHNAAAHAAQGVSAGDPCPVCTSILPEGFRAPSIAGEDEARGRLTRARDACAEAERVDGLAEGAAQQAAAEVTAAETKHRDAQVQRDACAVEAIAVVGADLAIDDSILLMPLRQAVTSTGTAVDAAKEAHIKAGNLLAVARNEVKRRETDTAAARAAVVKAEAILVKLGTQLDATGASVPEAYRPPLPLTADGCKASRDLLEARARELGLNEATRRNAASVRTEAEKAREALRKRHRDEVEVPAAGTAQPLAALQIRLAQAEADAGGPIPVPQPPGPTVNDQEQWARSLEEAAAQMISRLTPMADAARLAEQEASAALNATLEAAGFATSKDLADAKGNAEAERFAADKSERAARQQVPLAGELDKRIRPAQILAGELEQLVSLLSDAKFIRYVVQRKQLALLGIASAIFGEMTGEGYGFAEDFQVIDRRTGQPRDAKTLSGGEAFLASLALALGLVEIAGRSGGRLEALFLDEGFGSLDSSSLDEAMTALEHVTGDDRLVAVISHLKAVSERIENVLYVKRDPVDRSSAATWIGSTEKDRLVEEEMEQGLLM